VGVFEHESLRTGELSALESQVLKEKAKGLSDLEVASRLFLYERDVRAITQKLKRRYLSGKITDSPYSQYAANEPTRTRALWRLWLGEIRAIEPMLKAKAKENQHKGQNLS